MLVLDLTADCKTSVAGVSTSLNEIKNGTEFLMLMLQEQMQCQCLVCAAKLIIHRCDTAAYFIAAYFLKVLQRLFHL